MSRVWVRLIVIEATIALLLGVGSTIGLTIRYNQVAEQNEEQDTKIHDLELQNMMQDVQLMTLQLNSGNNVTVIYTVLDTGTCTELNVGGTSSYTLYYAQIGTLYVLVGEIGEFSPALVSDTLAIECEISNTDFNYAFFVPGSATTKYHYFTQSQLDNMTFTGPNTFEARRDDALGLQNYRTVFVGRRVTFSWHWFNLATPWDNGMNTFNFVGPTRFGLVQTSIPFSDAKKRKFIV